MQRSLTRLSSSASRLLHPASGSCGFVWHPGSRFVGQQSVLLGALLRKEYCLVGRGSVFLLSSNNNNSRRRHYNNIRGSSSRVDSNNKYGVKTEKKQPPRDAIALNKQITGLGKEGKWNELLGLIGREKHRFNNVNWATAFSQLGKTQPGDNLDRLRRDLRLDSFTNEYAACLHGRGGFRWAGIRGVANVVHAIGKIGLTATTTTNNSGRKSILLFVSKHENARRMAEKGTPQALANVAWAFATLDVRAPKFFRAIETRANWLVRNGTPQTSANVAWAFATLGVESPKLFGQIEKRTDYLVKHGSEQDVANLAWAFAKQRQQPNSAKAIRRVFAAVENRIDKLIENGNVQDFANTAWAFATQGFRSPTLLAEIDARSDWLVANGKPQEVANTAWAFATLAEEEDDDVKKASPPKLFAEIESRADWLVANGTPQAVANVAWSFAKMGVKSPRLFAVIETRGDWLTTNGTPQAVTNTAWAFAKLDHAKEAPGFFAEIETHADWLATTGTPQNVSNLAWACARAAKHHASNNKVFAETEKRVGNGLFVDAGTTPQVLSNTAWAFAVRGIKSPVVSAEIEKHAGWLVRNGTTRDVAMTAWACATLGVRSPKLFSEIDRHAGSLIEKGKAEEVTNITEAFATLGMPSTRFLAAAATIDGSSRNFEVVKEG